MASTFMNIYSQQGKLPVWHLDGNETDCMVGVHSVPIIVDAALKGVEGVDPRRALAEVKKFAQQPVPDGGLEYIDSLGYLPADKVNWSVSRALEYCIDDDAVARLASALGDEQTAEYYAARAKNYRHYFDPVTGYMRGFLMAHSASLMIHRSRCMRRLTMWKATDGNIHGLFPMIHTDL